MKAVLHKLQHTLALQLLWLHLKAYQVLLLFWVLLALTLEGRFARSFGAASLLLDPEYLGRVGPLSLFILGIAFGMFVMSWNIACFILNGHRLRFLATTYDPFATFCINNALIPLAFLGYYLFKLYHFQHSSELRSPAEALLLLSGFLGGLLAMLAVSFGYFFSANRSILSGFRRRMGGPRRILEQIRTQERYVDLYALPVSSYLTAKFHVRRVRPVDHYQPDFLEAVFRRHHLAAVVTVAFAFVLLVGLSYLMDYGFFRIPAGASVLIFLAVLIGLSAAFSHFTGTWSLAILALLLLGLNQLISRGILDTRSRAYGLDYRHMSERPRYSFRYLDSLFSPALADRDRDSGLAILDRWRARFPAGSPPRMLLVDLSGGGLRAALWSMEVLQEADRDSHGALLRHCVLITGASGGMIAGAYYRELRLEQLQGKEVNPDNPLYTRRIGEDLLNAVFSSFAINDFFTPFNRLHAYRNAYPKDRGYAFEQQLEANTHEALNHDLAYYAAAERQALVPQLLLSATVTSDGRKLLMGSLPRSYLCFPEYRYPMRPERDVDGIDLDRFFGRQHPGRLALTTALRMSATFPYVLPNVYLPTRPIVDVMDAGLRDNYGQETSMRFIHVFRDWIDTHTSGVLLMQVRDTRKDSLSPIAARKGLGAMLLEPLFTVQRNWSAFQDYQHDEQLSYESFVLQVPLQRLLFQYVPPKQDEVAALSWHLTGREKQGIHDALSTPENQRALQQLEHLLGN